MSKKASNFQKKVMSLGYRGKEIFKPLNTGWIDDHVACVREWIANIFFYTKNGTTIMIDAGYNYDRLTEKMGWLALHILVFVNVIVFSQAEKSGGRELFSYCANGNYFCCSTDTSAVAVFLWALYVLYERRYACLVWVSFGC